MLKFMENEEKIFRAWLKRHVKIDKKITGKKLSELTGIKGPSITSYHSGRVIDGERIWPTISFEKRVAILQATGVSYEEMIRIGKKELESDPALSKEEIKAYFKEFVKEAGWGETNPPLPTDLATERHRQLLEKFKQKELALKINQLLVEIEEINMDTLEDAIPVLNLLKIQAEKEAAKKRDTGNDKQ
jgi:transcriptional regulator with XRE-family HTH domain